MEHLDERGRDVELRVELGDHFEDRDEGLLMEDLFFTYGQL